MSDVALCTEEEITELVHRFYAEVRRDEVLGPIFNEHVDDWDHHLGKLVDFWSAILLKTRRFSGSPMTKHVALPMLSEALFQRWLELFEQNAYRHANRAMADYACKMAARIAQSLWLGYQIQRSPDAVPKELNHV